MKPQVKSNRGRPPKNVSVAFALDQQTKAGLDKVMKDFESKFGIKLLYSQAAQMIFKEVFAEQDAE